MDFSLGSARTHELTSVIEKVCQRKANPVTLIRDILMKIQFTSRSFLSSLQLQLKLRSSLISVRSPYVRQIRPFAPPIKLLLSELIEVRIWTSFAKFMLIRRPGRSNGNLIVLESRSTFRETLTIRTGHMPAFCSTRPSWTRTSARWPAPARMKSASKQFPACSKSSWQVSTFDSPHNPQNVRLSSNHTPNFRNTQFRLPGESLFSHITHQSGFWEAAESSNLFTGFCFEKFSPNIDFPAQVSPRLSATVQSTTKRCTRSRFNVCMATTAVCRKYFYSNWLQVENWGKWSVLCCSNAFDDMAGKAVSREGSAVAAPPLALAEWFD